MQPFDYLNTSVKSYARPSEVHGVGLFALVNIKKGEQVFPMWNGKTERVLIENLGAPGSLYTSSNTKYLTYIDIRELGYSGTKSSVCEYTFRIENNVITNVSIKGSGGYYFLCYNN